MLEELRKLILELLNQGNQEAFDKDKFYSIIVLNAFSISMLLPIQY